LFLSNSYDGSTALHVRWTPVRVVCNNTYNIALSTKTADKISIRHTNNYTEKLEQARKLLDLTNYYYSQMSEKFNNLLNTNFSEENMLNLAKNLFPETETKYGLVATKQTKENRSKLLQLFYHGPGQKEVQETKWAALNAVTDFVDHHSKIRCGDKIVQEARIATSFLGSGQYLRQKAFNLLAV
jgi:phage/plasmid-like protein (TIGR03299 family)